MNTKLFAMKSLDLLWLREVRLMSASLNKLYGVAGEELRTRSRTRVATSGDKEPMMYWNFAT